MKKLIVTVALATLMASCTSNKNKYTITAANGTQYGANFYNKTGDGCIQFNDIQCGCGENKDYPGIPTILCGSYTIVENKVER
jgi:hypothetical protein